MILVCAFYAIAWLPEKLFLLLGGVNPGLLTGMNISMEKLNNIYSAGLFFGFLYICANLTVIGIRRCLDVVS